MSIQVLEEDSVAKTCGHAYRVANNGSRVSGRRVVVAGILVIVAVSAVAAVGFNRWGRQGRRYATRASEARIAVAEVARGVADCFERQRVASPWHEPSLPEATASVTGSSAGAGGFECVRLPTADRPYVRLEWERATGDLGVARGFADLNGDGEADVAYEQAVRCPNGAHCQVGSFREKSLEVTTTP